MGRDEDVTGRGPSWLRHASEHVRWRGVLVIWGFLLLLAWGNPRWWAAALFALAVPAFAAMQGHLLCGLDREVRRGR